MTTNPRYHVVNRGGYVRVQLYGGYDDLTPEEAIQLGSLLINVGRQCRPITPIEGEFKIEQEAA